jgi:hypothetical protein
MQSLWMVPDRAIHDSQNRAAIIKVFEIDQTQSLPHRLLNDG